MRKALTDVLVRNLTRPATGRLDVTDDRCQGLTLRITSSDVKSWCFRFRDPRSRKALRATIGRYPDVSLAQARARATELRREVAGGENPVERKRREREEATTKSFSTLAERYLIEHARRFKRSWSADERNLRLHVLPVWKGRRYDEIERRDMIALSERLIAQGKPILANRVQALVSSMYSFALDADLVRSNPCARLRKRSQERVRRRVLSDDELRLFWARIVESPVSPQLGMALRLILLTGARAGEMAGAQRSEFRNLEDPERAAWLLPPERTKNGRGHLVPLSDLARVTVLEVLSGVDGAEERLLPSPFILHASITPHALAVAMT